MTETKLEPIYWGHDVVYHAVVTPDGVIGPDGLGVIEGGRGVMRNGVEFSCVRCAPELDGPWGPWEVD